MFPPSRNVRLTEEAVETLYLLGEQDRIVGIYGYVLRPLQASREKPLVSSFTSANIDKIQAHSLPHSYPDNVVRQHPSAQHVFEHPRNILVVVIVG